MNDIAPIGRSHLGSLNRPGKNNRSRQASALPTRGQDKVELSHTARLLSQLKQLPDVRQDLVARVRQEIADGTYETDEKINAAVSGVLEDLNRSLLPEV